MPKKLPGPSPWAEPDAEEVLDDVKTFSALVEAKVRSPEVREEWRELSKHLEAQLEKKAADEERERLEDELEKLNEKLDDANCATENAKLDKEHCLIELRERINKMFGSELWRSTLRRAGSRQTSGSRTGI